MCDCLNSNAKDFAACGLRIITSSIVSKDLTLQEPRAVIAVEWTKERCRKPLPRLMAACCPFCGARYPEPNAPAAAPRPTTYTYPPAAGYDF
jgi:hypothetical protein